MVRFPRPFWLLTTAMLWLGSLALAPHAGTEPTRHAAAYRFPLRLQQILPDGYRNLVAIVRWMNVLDRYGGWIETGTTPDMQWLGRELDIITRWNPRADHAYEMAALVIPWRTHDTHVSSRLLLRAMRAEPRNWRWPFYRGFNAYWFDRRPDEAVRYLKRSASLPGAPALVASLAARMEAEQGSLTTALSFLQSLMENRQDEAMRQQIRKRILEIRTEMVLRAIEQRLANAGIAPAPPEQLRARGIRLPGILPDGGRLIYRNGRFVSSRSGKRFRLYRPPHRSPMRHRQTGNAG